MTSVSKVPGPQEPAGEHLSVEQAGRAVRRVGLVVLTRQSFTRFRYGDGFSHSRALALQLCLAIVPLVIALVGLSSTLHTERAGQALRQTVLSLAAGDDGDGSDGTLRATLERALASDEDEDTATAALVLGLVTGLLALTTAMGQVERGANRIYGISRDRPTLHKYSRAAVLTAAAGLPAMLGFLLIVAGPTAERSLAKVYGIDRTVLIVLRWPISLLLSLGAITVLLRYAPRRRRQPGWSWLTLGAGLALVLWMLLSYLLGLYLEHSGTFGAVYGQLTSVMALLVWAQLTAMAILLGVAFTAQLEAVRAGVDDAALPDPEAAAAGTSGTLNATVDSAQAVLHRLATSVWRAWTGRDGADRKAGRR